MPETMRLSLDDRVVVVRRAEGAELIDLRHRVLRDGLPREQAIFPGDELPTTHHYGAFFDSPGTNALCCASFHLNAWQDKPAWQLRGMATDPAWKGRGLGRAVMEVAVREITRSSPVHQFWCNARLIAIPFYQKLGWKIASERFEIPTAGPHHQMVFHPAIPKDL